jgi:hypothetical protein
MTSAEAGDSKPPHQVTKAPTHAVNERDRTLAGARAQGQTGVERCSCTQLVELEPQWVIAIDSATD